MHALPQKKELWGANPDQRWLRVLDILCLQANLLGNFQKVQNVGRHRQNWVVRNETEEFVELLRPFLDHLLGKST